MEYTEKTIFSPSMNSKSLSSPIKDKISGFVFLKAIDKESWIMGTNKISENANAVIGGPSNCPKDLILPRSFTYGEVKYLVEEIGYSAFYRCGKESEIYSIFVPNTIKIIRKFGLCDEDTVNNFTIEQGSMLELLEEASLQYIGYNNEDRTSTDQSKILILPSTLKTIENNSLFKNNLFNIIIYCGVK